MCFQATRDNRRALRSQNGRAHRASTETLIRLPKRLTHLTIESCRANDARRLMPKRARKGRADADQMSLFDLAYARMTMQCEMPVRTAGIVRERPSPRAVDAAAPASEVYRLRDLMRIFGYADENSFRGWRIRNQACGFPAPLPGCTRPLKWDRRQVDAWRSGDVVLTPTHDDANVMSRADVIALAREKLRLKAALRL
jgi:hypothetical protein